MERFPGRRQGVAREGRPRVGPLRDRRSVAGHDRDAIGREVRTPIGIAEWIDGAPFAVQVDGHAAGTGILDEPFDAPQVAAGDDGG